MNVFNCFVYALPFPEQLPEEHEPVSFLSPGHTVVSDVGCPRYKQSRYL